MKKIAFFVSGGGTDMQSVLDGITDGSINAEAALVICGKDGIFAIERAKKHGIPYYVFSKEQYPDVDEKYERVMEKLEKYGVDFIILAGYLGILNKKFIEKYRGKIINVHPALIPKYCGMGFYGMKVHEAVIAAGETESGVTVHFADEGVDTGEIILQEKVPVYEDDTAETLAMRVLAQEHKTLPKAVAILCNR